MQRAAVIMAGGGGTRFWPVSRMAAPKQLVKLTGDDVMINETIKHYDSVIGRQNTFIVTNEKQAELMDKVLFDEVDRSQEMNPRTAIGQAGPLHYFLVVSDGRTKQSPGMSLLQLAQVMQELGCETAYNLDGGGSSAIWFNGKILNKPTTYGKVIEERSISDIVYIGK